MERIVLYKCEICGLRWNNIDSAARCEAKGPGKIYPIGCIYGNHTKGAMYENMTFAVATNNIDGHCNRGASWACRGNLIDSLGEKKCAGPSLKLGTRDCLLDTSTDHFKRMVKWLRRQRMEITFWDGEKPVSYATFMKNYKKDILI